MALGQTRAAEGVGVQLLAVLHRFEPVRVPKWM